MSEQMRESLSALMDDEANELEVQRVLSQIDSDEDLRCTWVRYNIARDALSAQHFSLPSADISGCTGSHCC